MQETKHVLSCLVVNHSGVLSRISGLFARRGYNIDSLSVCATEDPKISRMTIVSICDEYIFGQLTKQLDKLYDVIYVSPMNQSESVMRELLLIKLENASEKLSQIMEITKVYKAKTVDLSPSAMVLELTGDTGKLDAFIKVLEPYHILEMARTGITAIFRDDKCLKEMAIYEDKR